jgi:hypothetical protein
MPIRPELRQFYGAAHRAYRARLIAIFGLRCLACGCDVERYLNLAHIRHDPRDPSQAQLLCPSCHARHDAAHRYAMMRRSHARKAGQLWLFSEIEWAPYPSWQIPRRVVEAAQGRLF